MALYHYSIQRFFDQWFGKAGNKSGLQKDREQHAHTHAKQEGKKREDQSQHQPKGRTVNLKNKDEGYFEFILGLYPGSTSGDIKNPYRELVLQYHPANGEWIYLTDGSRIHSSFYDQISSYISNKENELDELKRKKAELIIKWKGELGFVAKIRRIFSSEIFDEQVLWSQKKILSVAIVTLTKNIIDKREKINSILWELYDFWPGIPPDWEDRRQRIINEFNCCTQCGKCETRSTPLHVHHIIPVSKGGSHRLSNLEVLCEKCHQRKHHGRNFPYKDKPFPSRIKKKIETFQNAIEKGKYLKFSYRLYSREKDKHIVKPISIKRSSETILLYGFCYLSNQERKFSISKISNIAILNNLDSLSINRFPSDFIDEAISKGNFLYFHYTKGTGGRSWRTIKPTHYDEYKGAKIVSGYDYLTREIRHFAPQRMENIEILDDSNDPKPQKVISGKP